MAENLRSVSNSLYKTEWRLFKHSDVYVRHLKITPDVFTAPEVINTFHLVLFYETWFVWKKHDYKLCGIINCAAFTDMFSFQ